MGLKLQPRDEELHALPTEPPRCPDLGLFYKDL